MNTSPGIAHRIIRVILAVLTVLAIAALSRSTLIPLIFGGGSWYWLSVSWIILAGGALGIIAAPLLAFTSSKPSTSMKQTGLAAIHFTSAFVCTAFLMRLFSGTSRYIILVSALIFLVSSIALVISFVRKPAFNAVSSIGKLQIALSTLLAGMLFLFYAGPLIQILFGFSPSPTSSTDAQALAQLGAYAFIVLLSAVIGLTVIIVLRKLRGSTPVNSDPPLIK